MYTGHIGAALGAFGLRPRVPLALLLVAALLPDFVHCALELSGAGDPMWAWSHGGPSALLQAAGAGALTWAGLRDGRAAGLVAALALSHLPLDYVTSTKLPLWPGGPLVGLRLYERPALDFAAEAAVVVAGWAAYRAALRRGTVVRRWPVALLLGGLLALQAAASALAGG